MHMEELNTVSGERSTTHQPIGMMTPDDLNDVLYVFLSSIFTYFFDVSFQFTILIGVSDLP